MTVSSNIVAVNVTGPPTFISQLPDAPLPLIGAGMIPFDYSQSGPTYKTTIAQLATFVGAETNFLDLNGAVPDGLSSDPTDNQAIIQRLLSQGGIWSGRGGVYGVAGSVVPTLVSGAAPLVLIDTTLVQLTPFAFSMFTLDFRDMRNLALQGVTVWPSLPTIDATAAPHFQKAAGHASVAMNFNNIQGLRMAFCTAEGDGANQGMGFVNCRTISNYYPIVRNMQWTWTADPGVEQIVGIFYAQSTDIVTIGAQVQNLTGLIGDNPALVRPYQTDGIDYSICNGVLEIGSVVEFVGEGHDIAGGAPGSNFGVTFQNCITRNVEFWGWKSTGRAVQVSYNSCIAYDPGNAGFIAAGTPYETGNNQESSYGINWSNCQTIRSGTQEIPAFTVSFTADTHGTTLLDNLSINPLTSGIQPGQIVTGTDMGMFGKVVNSYTDTTIHLTVAAGGSSSGVSLAASQGSAVPSVPFTADTHGTTVLDNLSFAPNGLITTGQRITGTDMGTDGRIVTSVTSTTINLASAATGTHSGVTLTAIPYTADTLGPPSGFSMSTPGVDPPIQGCLFDNCQSNADIPDFVYRPSMDIRPGNYTTYFQGALSSLSVIAGGAAYVSPVLTISAPTVAGGTHATAHAIHGTVLSIAITTAGTGYVNPVLTVSAPDQAEGRQATATASTDSSGAINLVTVTDGGAGYLSVPSIGISGGGIGGVLTATLKGNITGAVFDNAGDGYNAPAAVTVTDAGGGSGAVITTVLSDGNAYKAARNDWVGPGTFYAEGTVVTWRTYYYVAAVDHTSSEFFAEDLLNELWTTGAETADANTWDTTPPTWTSGTHLDDAGIPWTYIGPASWARKMVRWMQVPGAVPAESMMILNPRGRGETVSKFVNVSQGSLWMPPVTTPAVLNYHYRGQLQSATDAAPAIWERDFHINSLYYKPHQFVTLVHRSGLNSNVVLPVAANVYIDASVLTGVNGNFSIDGFIGTYSDQEFTLVYFPVTYNMTIVDTSTGTSSSASVNRIQCPGAADLVVTAGASVRKALITFVWISAGIWAVKSYSID